jgi:hypothetical protein
LDTIFSTEVIAINLELYTEKLSNIKISALISGPVQPQFTEKIFKSMIICAETRKGLCLTQLKAL